MREKRAAILLLCVLLAGCGGRSGNGVIQRLPAQVVLFPVPTVVLAPVIYTVQRSYAIGPDGTVQDMPAPESLPVYLTYQPVREDVAQPLEGEWAYQMTQQFVIWSDEYLSKCTADFSDLKIVFTGDSVTAGVTADFGYPDVVRDLLQPAEVLNLGVGGSYISTIGGNNLCNRYTEIPEDADVIVLGGGFNDSFELTEAKLGQFTADLQGYIGNVVRTHPDAKVMYFLPMPCTLHDALRQNDPTLLPQSSVRQTIANCCAGYDVELIDFYNTLCMNPFDARIRAEYYSDDVHPNNAGQTIIGKVCAARIAHWAQNRHYR